MAETNRVQQDADIQAMRAGDEELPRRDADSVIIPTPFGQFSAKGQSVVTIILLCAIIACGAWFLKTHDETTHALVSEIRDMKYILLLPQDKRDRVADRIAMPEFIRDALR